MYFAISLSSPFGKRHGRLFEQTLIPFAQGFFFQVWLKLIQLFWRFWRRFINFALSLSYPYKKAWIPSTQICFVSSLVEIGTVILEKRWKCEKFTDGGTDRRQVFGNTRLSFYLRWAKNFKSGKISLISISDFILTITVLKVNLIRKIIGNQHRVQTYLLNHTKTLSNQYFQRLWHTDHVHWYPSSLRRESFH